MDVNGPAATAPAVHKMCFACPDAGAAVCCAGRALAAGLARWGCNDGVYSPRKLLDGFSNPTTNDTRIPGVATPMVNTYVMIALIVSGTLTRLRAPVVRALVV